MRTRTLTITLALTAILSLPAVALAQPQPDANQFPWEGEIKGTDVYVRSGPGVNYYPCAKISTGERVVVLGEKFGWYQITPPPKCFSYVDMSSVERQPGAAVGKISQDQVYVRAGSDLEKRKTSTQMVLNKGASVNILGEADGFYKIAPPKGATLYISKQYVQQVAAKMRTGLVERHLGAESKAATPTNPATPAAPVKPGATPIPADRPPQPALTAAGGGQPVTPTPTAPAPPKTGPAGATPTGAIPPKPAPAGAIPNRDLTVIPQPTEEPAVDETGVVSDFDEDETPPIGSDSNTPDSTIGGTRGAAVPAGKQSKLPAEKPGAITPAATGRYAALLTILESELRTVMQTDSGEQAITSLRDRFAEIAGQKDEDVPARVAQIRMSQLDRLIELRAGKVSIAADTESLSDFRAKMNEERMKIMRQRVESAWQKFDLEGELRQSYAFAPEKHRFRLVDPNTQMTIAYIDVPPTTKVMPDGLQADELIGRLVGIRTSGQKYNPATQVPIAVALEIADLSTRTTPAAPSSPKQELASPGENKPPETAKSTKERPTAGEGEQPPAKPMAITGQEPPPDKPRK